MKTLIYAIAVLLVTQKAYSNQKQEINEFCRNKIDIISCIRDYNTLPELKELPLYPQQEPISIKVIPYLKPIKE